MQPGHFCTHAIDDLELQLSSNVFSESDSKIVLWVIYLLKNAIKFSLPENGLFYDRIIHNQPEQSKLHHEVFDRYLQESNLDPDYETVEITDYELESWAFPYQCCAFEYFKIGKNEDEDNKNFGRSKTILICIEADDDDKRKLIIPLEKNGPNYPFLLFPFQIEVTDGPPTGFDEMAPKIRTIFPDYFKRFFPDLLTDKGRVISKTMICNSYTLTLMQTFSFLRCKNVYIKDIPAPKHLNKARSKKRKTPLYAYKVLEVKNEDQIVNISDSTGRKHKSPRIHLRRGHIRTFQNGTSTYVSPCVVGSRTRGIIHKDYAVGVNA